jgi:hypothetical protein
MSKPEVVDIHYAKIYFNWSWPGVGFGETSVGSSREDGHLVIDAECMSKERARQLLYALVDKVIDEAELR